MIGDGGKSANISGEMIERRRWRGHWKGWTGRDVSWNDNISSIKVKHGCLLKLQEASKLYWEFLNNSRAEI